MANVTIANNGTSAINGWTLTFTFPGDQKITNAWNGTVSQSGENVSITNASYNAAIAAGGSHLARLPGHVHQPATPRPPASASTARLAT